MFKIRRLDSKTMFIITTLLIILIGAGDFHSGQLTYSLNRDTDIINNLGLIRGSIQRLIKLELADAPNDELVQSIDQLINEHLDDYPEFMTELAAQWEQIKLQILLYRNNPADSSPSTLLLVSEQIWTTADDAVIHVQRLSKQHLNEFRLIFALNFFTLVLAVIILIWLRRYVQNQLEYMVRYDALTSAITKAYFKRILPREMDLASKTETPLSLIVVDVDKFKQINDTRGHITGDFALQQISEMLIENLRGTDFLARIGGDEFVIIAPNTTLCEAKKLADRLQSVVNAADFPGIGPLSISLGIAEYDYKESMDQLFERADRALYQAKADGRNQAAVCS